jgi:hypothetical protein
MNRTGFVTAISLAVLVMVVVLIIGGEGQQSMATHRQPEAGPQVMTHTISLPLVTRDHFASDTLPFGIVMYSAVNDSAGLQKMEDAGAKWVTTRLNWAAIEPIKGIYNWSSFDIKAQNAQAAGMEVFVLFNQNPTWAAALPGGPVTDTQDLVDFAGLMAERYDCDGTDDADGHPCVHYWSFYAEPDNGDLSRAATGKGYWGHNGSGYAAMLSQVSPAIHSANPEAKVLIGGVAYEWFEEDGGPFVRSFLPDTLAALNALGGAENYLDAVAFHYYPIRTQDWPTILEKAGAIREIMADHGAGDLPLTCPEMGYWSSPNFGSSEEGQAYWVVQTFLRGISQGTDILSYYQVFDTVVAGSPEDLYPDRTSGLLRVDGSLKPAYFAYQTMTRELLGWPYLGPFGAAGAEGYVFGLDSARQKTVLWSQSGKTRVTFPYSRLRLVDTYGQEFDIWDNQPGPPGDLDGGVVGQIELEFPESQPFYVEPK